ncbi:MAG TPA: hypothetical protein GXX51_08270 [Firmicutes bacterium]|nr:hypothetical protein [Bacillota bacterium]
MIEVVEKRRDVTIVKMRDGSALVIACDSLGGIGPKESDVVKVPGYVVGRFTARVPLMEVMAAGATPVLLVDTLSVKMHPVGLDILRGIRDEVAAAGLKELPEITGSTEENIPTVQTALGVTVIGFIPADTGGLRIGSSKLHDVVVCIGVPKVGCEVRLNDPELADPGLVSQLLGLGYIHDILPVGSRGVGYEVNVMAETAGLRFHAFEFHNLEHAPTSGLASSTASPIDVAARGPLQAGIRVGATGNIDMKKSAGPATCLLVSLPPQNLGDLRRAISKPITLLGSFHVDEIASHPLA